MLKFSIFLSLFVTPIVASATLVENCGTIQSPEPYNYCITKSSDSRSTDVLYYMHGGGGDEHQWANSFEDLNDLWSKSGFEAPVVITVTFGGGWLLTEKTTAPASGLFELFRDHIMPEMEKQAIGRIATRRLIMGASMGGFNSAQLLLKLPENTFSRAYLACPAMIDVSPFASKPEIDDYLAKIGLPSGAMDSILALVKSFVSDEATWKSSVNPTDLAAQFAQKMPPTLVSTNVEDIFFRPGGENFANMAIAHGAPLTLKLHESQHCQSTVDELDFAAKFLASP